MTATWLAGHTYVPGSLVVPSTTPPVVRTALINAGFETGSLTGWVTTKGAWTIVAGGYNSAYCAQTTTNNSDPSTDGAELNNDPRVAVTPGKSITASAMAKLTNAGTDNGNAAIALMWYTGLTGSPMSASLGTHIVGVGGSWKQTTVTAVAPAGAAYVGVRLTASAPTGGNIQFDNAVWDYATQGPTPGLIYKAVQAAPGQSADTEPTWPLTNGVTVVDNTVTWEAIVMVRVIWQASPILLSGGTEPAWSTDIGGFVHDGTINWQAIDRRVSDVNCPQSKVVAIMASKVFAGDKDITRFSATANPLDWTTPQDAGYLPTGLQQANSNDIAVLAPYRSNLCPFNASTFQNWQVDPDPANMAILDQMEGIGSTYQQAASPVAQDLFYLAALGVRSVSVTASANSLVAGDIGIPIDVLVQDAMSVASANSNIPRATYYPSAGQYWLAFSHYPPDVFTISGHLPDSLKGQSVSYQYGITGGVLPYSAVTVVSGSLPTGLSISSSGLVTGTPTAPGLFSFRLQATDTAGTVANLNDNSTITLGYTDTVIADGPIGYWPMDDVAGQPMRDLSGYNRAGTYLTSGVTNASPPIRTGSLGSLAITAFTGGGSVPNASNVFTFPYGAAFSLEIISEWTSSGSVFGDLIDNGAQALDGFNAWRIIYRYGTSNNAIQVNGNAKSLASNSTPSSGVQHIVFTLSAGVGLLYVNGALATTVSGIATWDNTYSNINVKIGSGNSGYQSSYGFTGIVSDLAIYASALTATQVLNHAKAGGFA